jgi:hypothetical protein
MLRPSQFGWWWYNDNNNNNNHCLLLQTPPTSTIFLARSHTWYCFNLKWRKWLKRSPGHDGAPHWIKGIRKHQNLRVNVVVLRTEWAALFKSSEHVAFNKNHCYRH